MRKMDFINLTMGEKLKDLRKAAGIDTYTLSKLTGVGATTINDIENDKDKGYSYKTLLALCDYFNVSLEWFIGRRATQTPDENIQDICDYIGLMDNAVLALHNRLEEFKENEDMGVDIEARSKVLSKFIISDYFEQIFDCLCDEEYLKEHYYDGLRIASGDLSKVKAELKNLNWTGIYYHFDFMKCDNGLGMYNDIYSRHRINLFNIQDYILAYARSITDFDSINNFRLTTMAIDNILAQCEIDPQLDEYFKYMQKAAYPDENSEMLSMNFPDKWKNKDVFIDDFINKLSEVIKLHAQRIEKETKEIFQN